MFIFNYYYLNFKINNNYKEILTLDYDKLKYKELICFYDKSNENYLIEEKIYKISNHATINRYSYIIKDLDKFSKKDIELDHIQLFYICVNINDIKNNKDLKCFDIDENSTTIIYPNSLNSYKRCNSFEKSLNKKNENKFTDMINEDLAFIEQFDEEIFDPDQDYKENINLFIPSKNENNLIKNLNEISTQPNQKLKNLIIVDCHLIDSREWWNFHSRLFLNFKYIKNIYYIGCPFRNPPNKFGQPFIDNLMLISSKEIKSILFNKKNMEENKDENGKYFIKDSLINTLIVHDNFK